MLWETQWTSEGDSGGGFRLVPKNVREGEMSKQPLFVVYT